MERRSLSCESHLGYSALHALLADRREEHRAESERLADVVVGF